MKNDYGRIARALRTAIPAAQEATADAALAAMREAMAEAKHGTHWPDLPARSSAPGEAPAIQHEDDGLAAELARIPLGDGDQAVASQAPYAAELEFGRLDGHSAPRPFMAPAVAAVLPDHLHRLDTLIPRAARGR